MAKKQTYQRRGKKFSKTVRLRDAVTGESRVCRFSADDEQELGALITEATYKANRGIGAAPTKLTVSEFFEQWFEDTRRDLASSTLFTRRSAFRNRIEPVLGRVRLDRLTPLHVNRCLKQEHDAGHKPSTIAQTHTLLRAALNDAVEWGLIETNPATRVRAPRVSESPRTVWDGDQIRTFLDANAHNPYIGLFRLAIETGMRRGELLAVRWENVDLDSGVVRVRGTLSRDERGAWYMKGTTKTPSGMRELLLTTATTEALRAVRTSQLRRRLELGAAWQATDLVFDRGDGERIDPEALRNAFLKATAAAALPRIRFHDLRHGCATWMMENNVHLAIGLARLGQASVKSMKPYLHPALKMQRAVVELFEESIYQSSDGDLADEAV